MKPAKQAEYLNESTNISTSSYDDFVLHSLTSLHEIKPSQTPKMVLLIFFVPSHGLALLVWNQFLYELNVTSLITLMRKETWVIK